MADKASPALAPVQAEPQDTEVALLLSLRTVLGRDVGLLSTPYAIVAVRMLLSGVMPTEAERRLASAGVSVSVSILKTLKKEVAHLPAELKSRLLLAPASAAIVQDESKEKTALQILKEMVTSAANCSLALAEEIQKDKLQNTIITAVRYRDLMDAQKTYFELRKDLEKERMASEVVQSYKRAASDMCMLSMEYIDEGKKAEFLEKVGNFEQANL